MKPKLFIFCVLIVVLFVACSAPAQPTVPPTETPKPVSSPSPDRIITTEAVTPTSPIIITLTDTLEPVLTETPKVFIPEATSIQLEKNDGSMVEFPAVLAEDPDNQEQKQTVAHMAIQMCADNPKAVFNWHQPPVKAAENDVVLADKYDLKWYDDYAGELRASNWDETHKSLFLWVFEINLDSRLVSGAKLSKSGEMPS